MPAPPTQDTVILIDICRKDYSFSVIDSLFPCVLNKIACPACGSFHRFSRHGSYCKYHYASRVRILRVRCRSCGTTHAVMPAFSLPGTSIGTEEAEEYLLARAGGSGRTTASKALRSFEVSDRYPKQLDRMFFKAVAQAKALFRRIRLSSAGTNGMGTVAGWQENPSLVVIELLLSYPWIQLHLFLPRFDHQIYFHHRGKACFT